MKQLFAVHDQLYLGGALAVLVAQVSSLLYRRLPVGRVSESAQHAAGWKPAIQQVGNLRYNFGTPSAAQLVG